VRSMLGMTAAPTPSRRTAMSMEAAEEEEEALGAAAPSEGGGVSGMSAAFLGPTEVVGPQLLTSSVYDLMFARCVEFGLPVLAEQVWAHMLAMRQQPSLRAAIALVQVFLHARPVIWRQAVAVWQSAMDEHRRARARALRGGFKNLSGDLALRQLTCLTLEACVLAGQISSAAEIFQVAQNELPLASSAAPGAEKLEQAAFALFAKALCMPTSQPSVAKADVLLAELMRRARDGSPQSPPLPAALFTSLIVTHAETGDLAGALALLRLQKQQLQSGAQSSVSPLAYVGVIAACMERGQEQQALKLWQELHGSPRSSVAVPVTSSSAAVAEPASLQELPFALVSSRVADHGENNSRTALSFHFAPVALRQWHKLREFIYGLRVSTSSLPASPTPAPESAESDADADAPIRAPCATDPAVQSALREADKLLSELAQNGRVYLVWSLLHDLRGVSVPGSAGAPFAVEALNQLLLACNRAPGSPRWLQAHEAVSWFVARGGRPNGRSCMELLHAYAHAEPNAQFERALQFKHQMDERGEPLRPAHMAALTLAGARAVVDATEGEPLLHYEQNDATSAEGKSADATASPRRREALAAWSALYGLFSQFYPSLLTPAMHVQLVVAALHAGQSEFALQHFVAQFNADAARAPPTLPADQVLTPTAEAEWTRRHYFRSSLDGRTLTMLLQACVAREDPFRLVQLYNLFFQDGALDVPRAEKDAEHDRAHAQSGASLFAPIPGMDEAKLPVAPDAGTVAEEDTMIRCSVEADLAAHWAVVAVADRAQQARLSKKVSAASVPVRPDVTWIQAVAARPPAVSKDFSSSELVQLPWTAPTLASASLEQLEALTRFCTEVETFANDELGREPREPTTKPQRGSAAKVAAKRGPVWQQQQTNSPAAPGGGGKRSAPAGPSPPFFNVDLTALPSASSAASGSSGSGPASVLHASSVPSGLAAAQAALHLTLRRICAHYFASGDMHELLVRVASGGAGQSSAVGPDNERTWRRSSAVPAPSAQAQQPPTQATPQASPLTEEHVTQALQTLASSAAQCSPDAVAAVSAAVTGSSNAAAATPLPATPAPASAIEWFRASKGVVARTGATEQEADSEQVGAVAQELLQEHYRVPLAPDHPPGVLRVKAVPLLKLVRGS